MGLESPILHMERHHKSQGGEANTENNITLYHSKRTVSAKLKTNKQKNPKPVILVRFGWLRLPRWKEWEIKLEICVIPTMTSYRNSPQKKLKLSHLLNQVLK